MSTTTDKQIEPKLVFDLKSGTRHKIDKWNKHEERSKQSVDVTYKGKATKITMPFILAENNKQLDHTLAYMIDNLLKDWQELKKAYDITRADIDILKDDLKEG